MSKETLAMGLLDTAILINTLDKKQVCLDYLSSPFEEQQSISDTSSFYYTDPYLVLLCFHFPGQRILPFRNTVEECNEEDTPNH